MDKYRQNMKKEKDISWLLLTEAIIYYVSVQGVRRGHKSLYF